MTSQQQTQIFKQSEQVVTKESLHQFVASLMSNIETSTPLLVLITPSGDIDLGWGAATMVEADGPNRVNQLKNKIVAWEEKSAISGDTPPWMGGLQFFDDPLKKDGDVSWGALPNSFFFLPENHIRLRGSKCTWTSCSGETINDLNVEGTVPPDVETLSVVSIFHECAGGTKIEDWFNGVDGIQNEIRNTSLKKVVLARNRSLKASSIINFSKLYSEFVGNSYTNSHLFCLVLRGQLFFGATPELLFESDEKKIMSPAIAGSIRKGRDQAEDELLAISLNSRPKELNEHQIVVAYISEKLAQFCSSAVKVGERIVFPTNEVQHLYTEISGDRKGDVHPLDILNELHPTPAMCGSPQMEAMELLRRVESFPRGFYAGPMGYFEGGILKNRGEGKFLVGIRSALAVNDTLTLFAGAGILPESDPLEEWQETEQKLKTIATLFDKRGHEERV